MNLKKIISNVKLFSAIIVFMFFVGFRVVSAQGLTQDQIQDLQSGILYYNATDESNECSSGSTSTTPPSGGGITPQGTGAWTVNAQTPYYLEEYIINILQDIAAVAGVPQSDTVTQQHVLAMVAWAYAEGGNIANTGADFNIWNMGFLTSYPQLFVGGTGSGDGTQTSFVSFDAGVQGNTIEMTGSYQNRIAEDLIQPNSTAAQFVQALTYYQNYPGDQAWAQADEDDQQGYLNTLMNLVTQATQNYTEMASVEIGPGQEDTNHVPASELQYSGSGSATATPATASSTTGSTTGSATSSCGQSSTATTSVNCNGQTATGNAAIACDALNYDPLSYSQDWHSSGSTFHARCPTIGSQCATDCSGLVNIVLYDVFGNDIDETTYGEVADSTNFEKIPFSELQPGDFVQPNPDHVIIVESVQGNTIDGFAAQTSTVPQPEQVGTEDVTNTSSNVYLRYIGQGSSYANGQ